MIVSEENKAQGQPDGAQSQGGQASDQKVEDKTTAPDGQANDLGNLVPKSKLDSVIAERDKQKDLYQARLTEKDQTLALKEQEIKNMISQYETKEKELSDKLAAMTSQSQKLELEGKQEKIKFSVLAKVNEANRGVASELVELGFLKGTYALTDAVNEKALAEKIEKDLTEKSKSFFGAGIVHVPRAGIDLSDVDNYDALDTDGKLAVLAAAKTDPKLREKLRTRRLGLQ